MRGPLREADGRNFQVFAMTAINNVDIVGFSQTMVSPPDHLMSTEVLVSFHSTHSTVRQLCAMQGQN